MSQLDRYLGRMTKADVWPAGHNPTEVALKLLDTADPEALVIRWRSNDRCPMDDMLAAWVTLEVVTMDQARATSAARAEETARFLDRYRAVQAEPSDEELYELRAAFGPGVKIVNVVTGRTIQS